MTTQDTRWHAVSGFLVIALGIAGAGFERGGPPANAPVAASLAFFTTYRAELLTQSLMFVFSAGAYLWFFGALRSVLRQSEREDTTTSTVAFGAGIVVVSLQLLLQALQIAVASGSATPMGPDLAAVLVKLMWAVSVIAYVPLTVMLAAVAIGSWRRQVFPLWIAWLSASAAGAHLIMSFGLVVDRGPLAAGGAWTYALYAVLLVWLISISAVMGWRGRPSIHRQASAHAV